MELHKYDVVEAQVNRGGSVQGKRRPYVIVSNEIGTRKSTIVTIVPLTSVIKGLHLPVHACIEACTENGLKKYSMILGEQPQTISKNDVLRKIGADKVDDLDVAAMLEAINERITFLYDREHTIGHAFFTKLKDAPTLDTLKTIFKKSVIPLLQEYFYEDYQKIQLVLGDNGKTDDSLKFILDEKVVIRNIFKGRAEDVIDIEKKYTINDAAFDNLESYKQII